MMVIALLCGLRAASVNLVDRKDEYIQESRLKFNRYYRSTMAIIQETTYEQVTKMAGPFVARKRRWKTRPTAARWIDSKAKLVLIRCYN